MSHHQQVNEETCRYAYLDFDINSHRQKLATAAAFVDATDTRYGHSSKDLLSLGGSELSRLEELVANDHEWSSKAKDGIETRPPLCGNRIIVKLYWEVAPMACENFATLCLNGSLLPSQQSQGGKTKIKPPPIGECGKPLTYRNSAVHRIEPGFVIQAGDFVKCNGSGGESIYNGKKFKDERAGLALKHNKRGILSMGNSGKNSNSSQFYFTFSDKTPQCDGKHVIFGEILSGFEVLAALETVGSKDGTPTVPVTITDCGIFGPLITPAAGYWFDKPDPESFDGSTPLFVVRPRVVIVAPSEAVGSKFISALSSHCAVSSTLIHDGDDKSIASQLVDMLNSFQCDVVVVAPACSSVVDEISENPPSWAGSEAGLDVPIRIDEIILKAKPVEAVSKIHSNSWLATKRNDWKVDGV